MIKRKTIQSTLVLEAVRTLQCHATADEVYHEIAKDYPTISRGTVYRNLQRLCKMGAIRRWEIPGSADRFDHLCHDHYHVRCVMCDRVFDVDMDYIPDLENSIKDSRGFTMTGYDIVFKGICAECGHHSDTQQTDRKPLEQAHTGA